VLHRAFYCDCLNEPIHKDDNDDNGGSGGDGDEVDEHERSYSSMVFRPLILTNLSMRYILLQAI